MSFKNAFKNLIAHFGIVWAILLYAVICAAIIVGLSLPFILPIAEAFAQAGVFDGIGKAFSSLLGDGGWNGLWNELYAVYSKVISVFAKNDRIASLTMMFLIFVAIVAFRFFFGLYEIPLATVLDGRMSCNADYGFGGKFVSTLGTSVRFSLAKMPITIIFDAASFAIMYGVGSAIGMTFILPFLVIFIFVIMRSLRSSIMSCWAASVVNGCGITKGFFRSAEICFKRFGAVFSTYVVLWILIIAFGLFITIFTLGVGLFIALPFAMSLLGYAGITIFYNKTGRRYYVDDNVVTPPTENTV